MSAEMVTFPSNGGTASGYVARPDGGGTHPGVVVIQEWWGLDEHIKDVARRFAGEGFIAIAPDLYHGKVTSEPDEARKLVMGMQREQAAKDMGGAISCLQSLSDVAPKKVGMIGFCMGGALVLHMACHSDGLGAAAAFYPGRQPGAQELAGLKCPLLAVFGERDEGIPLEKVEAVKEGLDQATQPHEVIVYPGAPHAFFNDTRESYRPDPAADAWRRTLDLFRKSLG